MRDCVIAVGVTVTALFVCLLFASVPAFASTVYSKRGMTGYIIFSVFLNTNCLCDLICSF